MTPTSYTLLLSMALGFATAGLLASAFHLIASRPASFRMLGYGLWLSLLSVPFLAFAAPAIIMRNTLRGRRIENRPMLFVMSATIIALIWSLMSGRVIVRLIGL